MKIRQGFVSNSSSSSFIVAFDSAPKTAEDVKHQMFGNDENFYFDSLDGNYNYIVAHCPTIDIAEDVFGQIGKQETPSKEDLLDAISSGTVEGEPKYDFNRAYNQEKKEFNSEYQEKYDKKCKLFYENLLNGFISESKNKPIYVFNYSDHSAWGSMMEHDGIFDNLNYIRVSQH